ncbi:MAG: patatin-like phospholipase family protein [Candidatus Omnitrophica bacterium]|nr:patatin-like phospholipase family protein [Candidatus Omnitrophota bacterium]
MITKDLVFAQIPLLAELSAAQRQILKGRSQLTEYNKGQVIYEEASPADAFYCVVSGRVVIYTRDKHANKTELEYLHPGKYFGIISLLTDEPHSVTAEALNDCLLLVIPKEDFNFILKKIPSLAIDLSRTLSRRLKRKDIHQKTIFESTVISVFSSYSQAGKSIYALNLALSMAKETHKSVIILDVALPDKTHSLPAKLGIKEPKIFNLSGCAPGGPEEIRDFISKEKFGIDIACLYYQPQDASCVKKLVEIFSLLVNDYHYLILDLPASMDQAVFSMLNQSDLIHILTSPDEVDLARTRNLIERLVSDFNFHQEKINVVINEYKLSKLTYDQQVEILGKNIFATLPKIDFEAPDRLVLDAPESEYSKVVRRAARTVGETLVGLVFGVGVAYGFCHIGVLKVIEEEGIPIDVIAGSSIGALIASLWATGKSSSQILEIAGDFKEPKHIWNLIDLTFPFTGFIKGNKLHRFLKKHLGNKTFYDVKLPLKIIASDVKNKEPKILDKGLLADAIMASCAMPGVFAPFKFRGDILFDGGIINPLPTEALLKTGVKKIIAVNVTPSREDILRQYDKLKGVVPARQERKGFSLKRYLREKFKTNIVNFIFNSVEILQSEVAQKEAQFADVVLHPDTSGLYWLELHRSKEFARRGEVEARRQLDRIRQVVNE